MLSKLIKHEWKETWRTPLFLIILLGVLTVFALPFFNNDYQSNSFAVQILYSIIIFLYACLLIFIGFIVVIYFAKRFHKNLYTDESYLMHTLPVTTHDLILSKLIVASIWFILTNLALVAVGFVFGSYYGSMHNLMTELSQLMIEADRTLQQYGMSFPALITWLVLYLLVFTICMYLMLYASISIGQLFSKHKTFGTVLGFILLSIVMHVISSALFGNVFDFVTGYGTFVNRVYGAHILQTLWGDLGINAAFSVGLYFLSYFLMDRKLNLE